MTASGQKRTFILRHEYTEVVQNMRHCSNLRFAIFTIFFAVMGLSGRRRSQDIHQPPFENSKQEITLGGIQDS